MKSSHSKFRFFYLLSAIALVLAGCMEPQDDLAGASVGCGNPPAPAACAEGDILAGSDRILADVCTEAGCGAGLPLPAKVEFGMDLRIQVVRDPNLPIVISNSIPIRIVVFSPEGLPPYGEPLDTIDVMTLADTVRISAENFRPAAEKASRMTSEISAQAVVLNFLLEAHLDQEAEPYRVHLLQDVAFGFGARPKRDTLPDRIWPASLGKWPKDSVLALSSPNRRSLSGRLEWNVDSTALGNDYRIWVGVEGSPFWKEFATDGSIDSLNVPGDEHVLRAVARGPAGDQSIGLTREWVDGVPVFKPSSRTLP